MSLSPNYELAGFWLGFAYQKSGELQAAIAAYNRFLESNLDYVQGRFNLAYELMVQNDCGPAVEQFNRVL